MSKNFANKEILKSLCPSKDTTHTWEMEDPTRSDIVATIRFDSKSREYQVQFDRVEASDVSKGLELSFNEQGYVTGFTQSIAGAGAQKIIPEGSQSAQEEARKTAAERIKTLLDNKKEQNNSRQVG